MRHALLLLIALGMPACTPENTLLEFSQEQITVLALLQAGDSVANVYMRHTLAGRDEITGRPPEEPLTGATVRLLHGTNTVILRDTGSQNHCAPDNPVDGCYTVSLPQRIAALETYELLIDLPGGGFVRGHATVPAPPIIRAPAAGATLEYGGFLPRPPAAPTTVRWNLALPAARTEVAVNVPGLRCTFAAESWHDATGLDSLSLFPWQLGCDGALGDREHPGEVVVTVYDSVYARYYRETARERYGLRPEHARAGIEGALGVFAGAATARVPVRLVPLR